METNELPAAFSIVRADTARAIGHTHWNMAAPGAGPHAPRKVRQSMIFTAAEIGMDLAALFVC